jgi:hypothetical protein
MAAVEERSVGMYTMKLSERFRLETRPSLAKAMIPVHFHIQPKGHPKAMHASMI